MADSFCSAVADLLRSARFLVWLLAVLVVTTTPARAQTDDTDDAVPGEFEQEEEDEGDEDQEEAADDELPESGPLEGNQLAAGASPTVSRIEFEGNRKVEDDAMLANLTTKVGKPLDAATIRRDVRGLWTMGFFEDIRVEAESTDAGAVVLTYHVVEKPSIRKVYVKGNDDLGLDKINEVLDLTRDSILNIAAVKRNLQKIRELYVSKGFYLAEVDYQVRPVNESEVDIWFVVDERAKVQIRRVSFIGNEAVPDERLREIIATRQGDFLSFLTDSGTYQEDVFERDLAIITAFYYDQGHVTVKVGTPQVSLSRDKRYMYIAIPIEEGPVFDIGSLDFKGDLLDDKDDLMAMLQTEEGEQFSRSKLGEDIVRLNDLYKDRGYAYVNVNPLTNVNPETRRVDVVFEIDRGKKVYFERINIRGNAKTRDKVIRREMKIAEGDLYNQTNLEASRARITALGYFERVDISTRRGANDELIEVNVEVAERPTGTFQVGAGFSSVENFIAQAQISQNNLFGRGQTLALQAQLSSLRQLFLLRFVEPYFLDSEWTFAFDAYNQTRAFESFVRNSQGGNITFGYPLSFEARLFATYKLEFIDVSTRSALILSQGVQEEVFESSVANLFRGGVTSSVRLSGNYDSRNNRLFPTDGWYHNAFVEVADSFALSENKFVRWGGFSRLYQPIIGPFVLKVNAELGFVTSRSPNGVPISERYLVGGINDVRGFRPRTLGPQIQVQDPGEPALLRPLTLGGNMQLILNTEIEFPLFERVGISGVVFYDMGNAYNLESKWCTREDADARTVSSKTDPCFDFPESITVGLRKSVGFGFRWFSPIGPLRFEWGIPLDRQPGEESIVFEFTIGNFF